MFEVLHSTKWRGLLGLGFAWGVGVYIGLQVLSQSGTLVVALATGSPELLQSFERFAPQLQRFAMLFALGAFIVIVSSLGILARIRLSIWHLSLPALVSAALALWLVEVRLIAVPALLIAIVIHCTLGLRLRSIRATVISWCALFFLSFSPADLTFIQYPGPPRLVKVISGLPSRRLLLEAPSRNQFFGDEGGKLAPWLWIW